MNKGLKWTIFLVITAVVLVYLFKPPSQDSNPPGAGPDLQTWKQRQVINDMTFRNTPAKSANTYLEDLRADRVGEVLYDENNDRTRVVLNEGNAYKFRGDPWENLTEEDQKNLYDNVYVETIETPAFIPSEPRASDSGSSSWLWTPLIIVGVLFAVLLFMKKMGGGSQGQSIFALGKSKARVFEEYCDLTFNDVGGCHEAKEELGDIIDFLDDPERWTSAGARLPRGVLLEGPPGCGKTLLARAVAGESKAKFFLVSASEFVEMFVGVGAARVRDMFEQALKEAPAIIFIDELDAVGRKRGSGMGVAHDEREQTLNQLLVCMDGFEPNDRIAVLAATNRADILDKALLRPGRFDRRLAIPLPSREDRLEILKIHTRKCPLDECVSLEEIADRTDGFNGAELENLTNEATLLAIRRARQTNDDLILVEPGDFDRAFQKRKQSDILFDKVDAVLLESVTQLAQPTGTAKVRLVLESGHELEGDVIWMDSSMIKLKLADGGERIVAKAQIVQLEALAGTDVENAANITAAEWAARGLD